ncbi:riboflavin synthase [Puerhibacterium sp. TATVAM-FAB25]|uniref:riboflavin synthase n=1 Tax=Puerhibacterium sp. TATVAM-FAB25 TaxID=3093699 RepID=UPI00397E1B0E
MFTGIVEETGRVRSLTHPDATAVDAVLVVEADVASRDAHPGDSIAVAGVCLTVTGVDEHGAFAVDVMPETLRRTSLGALRPGSAVNLERALPAGGRLGGHVVQGHVDGTATLLARRPGPRWDELTFALPAALAPYVATKGSVTLDGVSLTVAALGPVDAAGAAGAAGGETFTVCLVPTTLARTTLGALQPGDAVNVEVDVLAKYVERLLAHGAVAGATGAAPDDAAVDAVVDAAEVAR